MATVNLGKIKPTWRNAWASGTAYTVDDMVSHGGTSYMCISNVSGTTTPNSDASNWDSMAVKGDTGNTGSQGVTGNTGSQGPIGNTGPSGFPSGGTAGQVVTNTSSGAGTWQDVAAGGKVLGYTFISGGGMTSSGTGGTAVVTCSGSYTPQSSTSKILAIANCQIDARPSAYSDNIRWAVFRDTDKFNEHWLVYGDPVNADLIISLGSTFDLGTGHTASTAYTFALKLWCAASGDSFRVHERSSMLLLELEV